jgi:asparagine N-glycosylation enzyme membrane subunit Stt3
MEWLKDNTPEGSRIVSWWDYGHWINYFGLRNAVIRNDQDSDLMIGEVAADYIQGTPQDLINFMNAHGAKYALFDMELVSSGNELGGKYGALNYLSCAQNNETDVTKAPGSSECEANNLWETAYVSSQPCTISSISNVTGLIAYEMYQDVYQESATGQPEFMGTYYTPVYPPDCVNPTDPNVIGYCTNSVKAVPTYCVGPVTLASGQQTYGTYYLNQTEPNGDLLLNKAVLEMPVQLQNSTQFGPATAVTLFYTNDPIWLENGQVTSGYSDRKGQFYSSNLYSALFLNELPGFTQVYSTPDNVVKIYELGGG